MSQQQNIQQLAGAGGLVSRYEQAQHLSVYTHPRLPAAGSSEFRLQPRYTGHNFSVDVRCRYLDEQSRALRHRTVELKVLATAMPFKVTLDDLVSQAQRLAESGVRATSCRQKHFSAHQNSTNPAVGTGMGPEWYGAYGHRH